MSEGTQYVASLSYGKDSMAMLHVIKDVLHWQLDRIITADVWATDTIPADLPPMVEFKKYADEEIKKRWGIKVEHFKSSNYEEQFYRTVVKRKNGNENWIGKIRGFPFVLGPWCNRDLKMKAINEANKSINGGINYIGIAVDEPKRIARHETKKNIKMPLVEANWTEQMCRDWCEQNGLLSPIYTTATRGGCWFCHNQPLEQLRLLRKNYRNLWELLLKWDLDSTVTFQSNGKTVHDLDKRFKWEDDGFLPASNSFRWEDIENPQPNSLQLMDDRSEREMSTSLYKWDEEICKGHECPHDCDNCQYADRKGDDDGEE